MCHLCTSYSVLHGFAYQLKGTAEQEAYIEAVESQRAPFEEAYAEAFALLLESVGEKAAGAITRLGTPEAALGEVTNALDDVVDLYAALFADVIPHFAAEAYGQLKHLLPRRKQEDRWLPQVEAYVKTHLPRLGVLATDTLRDLMQAIIADGQAEGLSVGQMTTRVLEQWGSLTRFQAYRAVRTETVASSNYATLAGAQATGLPMEKEWLAVVPSDGRTREDHIAAHGQRVKLDQPFIVGGEEAQYPGDPSLSPAQRILCRCTTIQHVVAA